MLWFASSVFDVSECREVNALEEEWSRAEDEVLLSVDESIKSSNYPRMPTESVLRDPFSKPAGPDPRTSAQRQPIRVEKPDSPTQTPNSLWVHLEPFQIRTILVPRLQLTRFE